MRVVGVRIVPDLVLVQKRKCPRCGVERRLTHILTLFSGEQVRVCGECEPKIQEALTGRNRA